MVLGNLVDLARLLLINEECDDLQIAVDGRELTRNNIRKKKSTDVKSVTNAIDEIEVSLIFLVVTVFAGK